MQKGCRRDKKIRARNDSVKIGKQTEPHSFHARRYAETLSVTDKNPLEVKPGVYDKKITDR